MLNIIRKRKPIFVLAVALILMMAIVSASSAQGLSGSGWWVGFTVQNPTSGNGTMVATAYHGTDDPQTDTVTFADSVVVPGDGAVTFHPGLGGTCDDPPTQSQSGCRIELKDAANNPLPANFEGSAVVSSDVPAISFASLNNNRSGSVGVDGGKARAAYQGTGGTAAANTLFFPSFKNNFAGQSTIFYVQAAGADADVTITYTTQESTPQVYTENKVIKANRMYAFLPAAASVPSCGGGNNDNCRGGAIVTSSSGPLAGTVVEYEDGVSVAKWVLSSSAFTPADIGTTVIAPALKNDFGGGTTGAAILNTTNTQALVDLTFVVTALQSAGCAGPGIGVGTVRNGTVTVPAQGTEVIRINRGNTQLPACVLYAMTAEDQGADQELAITVNQTQVQGTQTLKSKYNGFNAANATGTALFPLVKENFGSNTSGVTIVNAGSITTKVDVTYAGSLSSHTIQTIDLAAGQAVTLRQVYTGAHLGTRYTLPLGQTLPPAQKYAVTATAVQAGARIVGMSQEATLSGTRLDIKNYEGFNQ
jgi:hypothetical protein